MGDTIQTTVYYLLHCVLHLLWKLLGTRGNINDTVTSMKAMHIADGLEEINSFDLNFRDEIVCSWEITVLRLSCFLAIYVYLSPSNTVQTS